MTADQLRQALDRFDYLDDPDFDAYTLELNSNDALAVRDAARFALRVWEGDEQLVEKVAEIIFIMASASNRSVRFADMDTGTRGYYLEAARSVLAAISGSGE